MKIKTINQINSFDGKKILMRVDFNVPMNKGKIKEEFKIVANVPMIKFLIKHGATVILMTHLGDPKISSTGKIKDKEAFTTKPLAISLGKLLKKKVVFSDSLIGSEKLKNEVKALKKGQILLLENIRFYYGETKNDTKFAKQLATLGDIYINNAFAVSHRSHASVAAVKRYLPSYAGSLVEEEVSNLQKIVYPTKPFVAVMGGSKIDTKVTLLRKLSKRADYILVGGAIANNFLAARKFPIGKSLASPQNIRLAKKIDNKKIILPIDVIVSDKNFKQIAVKKINEVGRNEYIYDIGPETMKLFATYLKKAKTLIWNGPMGLFENERLRQGTLFVGRAVAIQSKGRAFGVVGGGETIEALKMTKMIDDIDWVSTGGGASLSFLGGEKMPGLVGLVK
ncbi:MAG: phosphoglycerate kinase [Patescibacteria group bacterium]|nr:phosphoglycerate kinase [Patescibacteria group bacterium]